MRARLPVLTPTDERVLRAVNRFRFLTAAQLNRLLWPNNTRDKNRYAQDRLQRLKEQGCVLPLREFSKPNVPSVYTLAGRGRQTLQALGETVPAYYRPSELEVVVRNPLFMPHTLAVIDVLIAAQRLTKDAPDVSLDPLLLERDLRRLALKITLPPSPRRTQPWRVTVVPDALFTLSVAEEPLHFVLELDRGTERRQVWQDKVAALTLWLASPESVRLMPSEDITITVVTSSPERREDLRAWTAQELQSLGLFEEHARQFAITDASPVALSPMAFFTGPHWHPPYIGVPDNLINLRATEYRGEAPTTPGTVPVPLRKAE